MNLLNTMNGHFTRTATKCCLIACGFIFLFSGTMAQVIPAISCPVAACTGSGNNTYTTETGMSGYNWNVSGGGTIVSGNGTYQIEVQWTTAGTHTLYVTFSGATSPGTLEVSVEETVIPDVTLTASLNPVCSGSMVTLTATPQNGGTTPSYIWRINDIIVSSGYSPVFTYSPTDGDAIWVILTASGSCADPQTVQSNTINMTVSPTLPVSVSISASANPVCAGTVVSYSATAQNGGTAPVYSWTVNGSPAGSNSSSFLYTPSNGDLIECSVNSSLGCASGNPATSTTITMNVTPVYPVQVDIVAS